MGIISPKRLSNEGGLVKVQRRCLWLNLYDLGTLLLLWFFFSKRHFTDLCPVMWDAYILLSALGLQFFWAATVFLFPFFFFCWDYYSLSTTRLTNWCSSFNEKMLWNSSIYTILWWSISLEKTKMGKKWENSNFRRRCRAN